MNKFVLLDLNILKLLRSMPVDTWHSRVRVSATSTVFKTMI